MRMRIELAFGLALFAATIRCLAGSPGTRPTSNKVEVLRRVCGSWGTAVVEMTELPHEGAEGGRDVGYTAWLVRPDGGKEHVHGIAGFYSRSAFGSGLPELAMADVFFTAEKDLVAVEEWHWKDKKVEGYYYNVSIFPAIDSEYVPGRFSRLHVGEPGEAPRKVRIAGSLKDETLAVTLTGKKDVISLRHAPDSVSDSRPVSGWKLVPPTTQSATMPGPTTR